MSLLPGWKAVEAAFGRCAEGEGLGPFLCLVRFEGDVETKNDDVVSFVAQKAFEILHPFCSFATPPDCGPWSWYECFPVSRSLTSRLHREVAYVYRPGGRRERRDAFNDVAVRAAALLPTTAGQATFITRPDVPTRTRKPAVPVDQWVRAIFAALYAGDYLQSDQLPDAKADIFWYRADAFAASLLAVDSICAHQPIPKSTGRNMSGSHEVSWWADRVVECGRNRPRDVFKQLGVHFEETPGVRGIRVDLDTLPPAMRQRYARVVEVETEKVTKRVR